MWHIDEYLAHHVPYQETVVMGVERNIIGPRECNIYGIDMSIGKESDVENKGKRCH
jgi:hypothetical protein